MAVYHIVASLALNNRDNANSIHAPENNVLFVTFSATPVFDDIYDDGSMSSLVTESSASIGTFSVVTGSDRWLHFFKDGIGGNGKSPEHVSMQVFCGE